MNLPQNNSYARGYECSPLPVYKKYRITSLLCIFETIIGPCVLLFLFAFVVAYLFLRSNIEHGVSEVCNLIHYRHIFNLQFHGLIIQTY